jgi:hypothetical protein
MFAANGSHPDGPRGAENLKNRREKLAENPSEMGAKRSRKERPAGTCRDESECAIIRATEILLNGSVTAIARNCPLRRREHSVDDEW